MRQAGRKSGAYLIGLGGRKCLVTACTGYFQFYRIVPGGLPGTVGSAGTLIGSPIQTREQYMRTGRKVKIRRAGVLRSSVLETQHLHIERHIG